MEFKEKLKEYQDIVNKELEKYVVKEECKEEILNKAVEYSLISSAKRLRPILILATFELFSNDIKKCMPYCVALEMIHNFSLIHDDLPGIDNDDFRHGKLTNHKKFNEATAILAGDTLLNTAYNIISADLLKTKNDNGTLATKLKIFNEFTIAVNRMIAGEYIDTEFEGKQIEPSELEYIHKNKTGELIKLPVRVGIMLADSSNSDLENLTIYAKKIGLAFQIKDDILAEEGDSNILGKPVGNDKKLGKCTYVSFYGLDGAKEILNRIIDEAINILDIYGEKAKFLKDLAMYIKTREK